ncbi:unnamed protein product, partial [Sphenostylis stenocarpa]
PNQLFDFVSLHGRMNTPLSTKFVFNVNILLWLNRFVLTAAFESIKGLLRRIVLRRLFDSED